MNHRFEHLVVAFGWTWWVNAATVEIVGLGIDLIIDRTVPAVSLDIRVGPWLLRLGCIR